ncbi:MAG: putative spermidine/putrescine transport system substrate-binding protein, partial [Chloroflexota bacterium]|nr:putative spermidine/putrescine transport system substrate-binding protein [Chloroflexota bacterium]
MTTTRSLPRLLTFAAGLVFVAAACNQAGTATTAPGGGGATAWTPDAALLASAKTEGALNVIALPRDWCGYGTLLDNFKAKTGLTLNEITPDAGSGQEIDAIKNNPNGGPAAPDTVDVGYSFGDANKALYAPYKVATFDSISQKDPDGAWVGDYY